jgi:hypothetical protein
MPAQAGEQMGRGWAFGLNEAMDQFGALIGPLAMAGILAWRGNFQLAFASLALPAVVTLLLAFGARFAFPAAGRIEKEPETSQDGRYPPAYWWYCLGAGLVGFGFADYSLIAFHLSKTQIVPNNWIPVFYAFAMGAGGFGSLVIGRLFDRLGLLVLLPVTVLIAVYAPLAFFGGFTLSLTGALLWGIGLGAHESAMPRSRRWCRGSGRVLPTGSSARPSASPGSRAARHLALSTMSRSARPLRSRSSRSCWR